MKIIITEQQASVIIDKMKNLISMVLAQKEIDIKDLDIVPTFFPKRGIKVILKLENKEDKKRAREIVDDLLGGVGQFGDERKYNITTEQKRITQSVEKGLDRLGLTTSKGLSKGEQLFQKLEREAKNRKKEGIVKPLVRQAVVRSTTPIGYDALKLINVPSEILLPKMAPKTWSTKNRYDAWYLYNGMKPRYNTFTKIGENTYRINNFLIAKPNLDAIVKYPKNKFSSVEIEKEMNFGAIHGNGGIEKGSDKFGNYIEFYDEWDLQPLKSFKFLPDKVRNFEVSSVTGGKPFWTRNRIYYDEQGNYYNWDRSPLYVNTQKIKHEGYDGVVDYIATKDLRNVSAQESLDDWNKIASYGMSKTAFTVLVPLAAFIAIQQSKLKDKEKKVYFNMVDFGKKKNMTLKEVKEYCDTKANEQECEVIYQGI